jgi:FkbM family methyltransferase
MHNGVLVEEGGYYGDWMARIITALRGHHEPQEELVFDAMVTRLAATTGSGGGAPVMVELGAFWAYYSLWLCHQIPGARAYGIEPDPAYLEVGRRNVGLNDLADRVVLESGVVGAAPGSTLQFSAESDGVERPVVQYDLASLMQEHDLDHVDLVLSDIQGWELLFVERALPLLRQGRVRFLLVSTHHHSISGDALTHQKVRDLLVGAGATLIAEHSVGESASGDGLLAVSFDPRDEDMTVGVSHVRARDSLFGELEYDLAAAHAEASSLREQLEGKQRELEVAQRQTRRLRRRLRTLRKEAGPPPSPTARLTSLGTRLSSWLRRRS